MKTKDLKHPMQPIGWDKTGEVIRFKRNKIVDLLLETSKLNLNDIASMNTDDKFHEDDYTQLMQLIGYSVSGYGGLSTSPRELVKKADIVADDLSKQRRNSAGDLERLMETLLERLEFDTKQRKRYVTGNPNKTFLNGKILAYEEAVDIISKVMGEKEND